MSPEDAIRENAKLVIAQFSQPGLFGLGFGYNREAVEFVEGFIERQRKSSPELAGKLMQTLGSYLGECLIHVFGGHWTSRDGQWCVVISDRLSAFPFNKVSKQFDHGIEGGDSILSFFDSCGPLKG